MTEERDQSVGCAEQIDRVSRRWCVDDDEIELVAGPQLVQTLDGHVFLRAAQRPGDAAVDRVGEDGLGALGVAGAIHDHAIEGGFGVEHQRPK